MSVFSSVSSVAPGLDVSGVHLITDLYALRRAVTFCLSLLKKIIKNKTIRLLCRNNEENLNDFDIVRLGQCD